MTATEENNNNNNNNLTVEIGLTNLLIVGTLLIFLFFAFQTIFQTAFPLSSSYDDNKTTLDALKWVLEDDS